VERFEEVLEREINSDKASKNFHQAEPEYAPIQKKKVLLMLWSLHGGGAERMAVRLIENLDPREFEVKIGLLRRSGEYLSEVDPSEVLTPNWDQSEALAFDDRGNQNIFKIKNLIRGTLMAPFGFSKILKAFEPDVMISFCKGTSIAVMGATWIYGRKKVKWIVREGNNTTAVIHDELKNPILRKLLMWITHKCFSSADCLLSVSEDLATRLGEEMKSPPRMIQSIHNATDIEMVQKKAEESVFSPTTRPYFIAAGRLHYQKAYDQMIRSYAASNAKDSHDLILLGKGPDETKLKELISNLGLESKVHLLGWRENPWAYIAKSEAFLLSSRWEGVPNIMIEAMACGVPIISTDCDFGPRELITNGQEGFLLPVDDTDAMSAAMNELVSNSARRKEMAEASLLRVKDFCVEAIVENYADLIRRVSKKH
jgi:glycosyltransferase involved in cell wall biosynthesis